MEFDKLSSLISGVFLLIYLGLLYLRYRSKNLTSAIYFPNLSQLTSAGSSFRVRLRWVLILIRVLAVVLLLIAFARPKKGLEVIKTSRKGIAIQMVLDRSSSMTEPLSYKGDDLDRLGVVKRVFEEFVLGNGEELKGRINDMIGLISFAGFMEENAPLTLDHQSLVNFAKTITPATKIEDGTMIGDAIYYATLKLISVDDLLKRAGKQEDRYQIKSKVIILLTDGQQTQGGMDPIEAARFAKENHIKLYIIAMVSEDAYVKNQTLLGQFFSMNRRPIDTRLIEEAAKITQGYFAKATSGEKLIEIYQEIDKLEKSDFEERFTTYKEQYQIWIVMALALLLIETGLSQTLFRKIP
ncbi:MAG: VWA domain-containing protein [Deltaproteobacteria bacterium]|nr:VWA domain-containing protein [Deltaproteobacteria bacterium]